MIISTMADAHIPQIDGRFWVTETHIRDSGDPLTFETLFDPGVDYQAVAIQRAADLNAQEAAQAAYVPPSLPATAARRAIYEAGLQGAVEAAVSAADDATKALWWTAGNFLRNDPSLNALASAIGLTDAQLDALFRSAAKLES